LDIAYARWKASFFSGKAKRARGRMDLAVRESAMKEANTQPNMRWPDIKL
jgi:hypothetical protein